MSDGSGAGRVIVNDLEVAFATQLLIQQQELTGSSTDSARKRRAMTDSSALVRERDDEVALDPVVRRVGPDAVERFVELRTLAQSWHDRIAAEATTLRHPSAQPATQLASVARERDDLNATAQGVLDASESLDSYLLQRSLDQRKDIQRVEHVNVLSAVILAPLALLAALALFWTGRRTLFFANAAERNRAALSRAMVSKAALFRGLTHDLKNPLGAAYGYAELLEDEVVGPVAPEQREMLGRIKGLVTLSVATVNDLLELYRDDTDGIQLQRIPSEMDPIVSGVVADFKAAARQASLTLTFDRSHHVEAEDLCSSNIHPTVASTDPVRVRQILGNLVSNAIKYTPAGGEVRLSIRGPDGTDPRIAIDVRDTGAGIPAPYQERIFEEFFRLPTNDGTTGSGVGLAISRRFAHLMGGDITVADWPGGGSVFTLWLPAEHASGPRGHAEATRELLPFWRKVGEEIPREQ